MPSENAQGASDLVLDSFDRNAEVGADLVVTHSFYTTQQEYLPALRGQFGLHNYRQAFFQHTHMQGVFGIVIDRS